MKVSVLSASARPGLAQIRQLKASGHEVRAITRQTTLPDELTDVEVVPADLGDVESLVAAISGTDVSFFTAPTFTERTRTAEYVTNIGKAVVEAGVGRLVYNTTTWYPDEPIGVPTMDEGVARKRALAATGAPATIIQPSLFMDNLLTKWAKPYILDGVFSYPHKEDLEVSWISLDDVGKWMIATMDRADCAGATLDVGGPETLRPTQVATLLGEQLGRPIVYRRITPREFGERMWGVFQGVANTDSESYISSLEKHYEFKNEHNPFKVDMEGKFERFGVEPLPMRKWLAAQDWTPDEAAIGSVSG